MLRVINSIIWLPFLIIAYPIATKFINVPISYIIETTSRHIKVRDRVKMVKKNIDYDELLKFDVTKAFYDEISRPLNSEVTKSSTLEIVTESTLQPLIQLYAVTSTCRFSYEFTFGLSIVSSPLFFSIVTSLLAFSWSMTTYNVLNKQGALDTDINLKARLLMFGYFNIHYIKNVYSNNFCPSSFWII